MGIKVYVDEQKFNVEARRAEETMDASRKMYEELKKQMDMNILKLSSDEEGDE